MTRDELRGWAKDLVNEEAGKAIIKLMDEHKLMREALEDIRLMYKQRMDLPDYIAAEALTKVSK